MASKFTPSIEDYLETIYQLDMGAGVKSTHIAEKLQVSKPSVHRAINTLAQMGLLTQEKYSQIYLTESGKAKAREVNCKHEILSRFLQETLAIPMETAEEEACKMEHGVSLETVARVEQLTIFLREQGKNEELHSRFAQK